MTFSPAFLTALRHVLQHEGGFADHPKDPGGATYRGITLATLRDARHNDGLTVKDLKNLTDDDIAALYHSRYWVNVAGDRLPRGVSLVVMDAAVLSGPRQAGLTLQRAINAVDAISRPPLVEDGIIGPETLKRAGQVDRVQLIRAFARRRMTFFRSLRDTFPFFGNGWTDRNLDGAISAAAQLA